MKDSMIDRMNEEKVITPEELVEKINEFVYWDCERKYINPEKEVLILITKAKAEWLRGICEHEFNIISRNANGVLIECNKCGKRFEVY